MRGWFSSFWPGGLGRSRMKMKLVNRMALVVTAKEPYYAWARSLEADSPIDRREAGAFSHVYLLDEPTVSPNLEKILRRHYEYLFEVELYQWMRTEEVWPKERTWEQFQAWFDVRLVETVFDYARELLDAS
jgi:hypothetical protein